MTFDAMTGRVCTRRLQTQAQPTREKRRLGCAPICQSEKGRMYLACAPVQNVYNIHIMHGARVAL